MMINLGEKKKSMDLAWLGHHAAIHNYLPT